MGFICPVSADEERVCKPNKHLNNNYLFECSYKDCLRGEDGSKAILCNECCYQDKKKATRRYCKQCYVTS